jgi:hypothetical protein
MPPIVKAMKEVTPGYTGYIRVVYIDELMNKDELLDLPPELEIEWALVYLKVIARSCLAEQ